MSGIASLRVWDENGVQHLLDIKGRTSIPTDYNFVTVQDFKKAKGDVTKSIDLPATANNVKLFGEFWNVSETGYFNPKRKLQAIFEFDTVVLLRGFLKLNDVKVEKGRFAEFNVTLFGGAVTLYKDIGKTLLQDLDWAEFNHTTRAEDVRDALEKNVLEVLIDEHEFVDVVTFGATCSGWSIDSGVTQTYEVDGFGNDVLTIDKGINFNINRSFPTEVGKRYRVEWHVTETPRPSATFEVRDCGDSSSLVAAVVPMPALVTQEFVAISTSSRAKIFMNPDPHSIKSFRAYEITEVAYGIQDFGDLLRADGGDIANNIFAPSHGLWTSKLKPYLKLQAILDKVFAHAGWTYESTFLAEDYFQKLFMLIYDGRLEQSYQTQLAHLCKVGIVTEQEMITDTVVGVVFDDITSFDFFDPYDRMKEDLWVTLDLTSAFYATQTGTNGQKYKFRIGLVFEGGDGLGSNVNIKLRRSSGTLIQEWNLLVPPDFQAGERVFLEESEGVISGEYYLEITSDVTYNPALGAPRNTPFRLIPHEDTFFECYEAPFLEIENVPAEYDFPFDVAQNIPSKVKCTDVIDFIAQRFNLLFIPSATKSRHMKIEAWNPYMSSGARKDWQNKLDISKTYVVEPLSNSEKQLVNFKTKEGEDILNKFVKDNADRVYGRQLFINDINDFATGEQNITSPDTVTPLNALSGSDIMIPRLYTEGIAPVKGELRIMVRGEAPIDVADYIIRDHAGGSEVCTKYNHFGHYSEPVPELINEDLNFGVESPFHRYEVLPTQTCYERYWRAYLDQLYGEEARTLTAYFDLNLNDIEKFRWNDEIYVLGAWWNVDSIQGFDPLTEASTKVKLVRRSRALSGLYNQNPNNFNTGNSNSINILK
jgi:hypothetical protein